MAEVHDTLAARAAARVGRVVCDKWRLDRVLGVGGVAAVYAARHRNGRPVAVKILHPELAVDASIRRRFLREGYVANRVEHPGAVVVLDDAIDQDGSVLLVMELLQGETLEGRARRQGGRLPPTEVLLIAEGVLSVLENAHARDVLHRDVTPSNVFVTTTGEIKLLDFGIARLRDSESERTVSVPGALGTPAFMPPEQARGLWEELDARSDLWAVGAVLFRMASGRNVHTGRTPSEQLLAAMTKRAPPLKTVAQDVPDALARVVDRALRQDPKKRWSDAAAFRTAVADAHAEIAGSPLSGATPLSVPILIDLADATPSMSETHPDGFGTTIGADAHRGRRLRMAAVLSAIAVAGVAAAVVVARPSAPSGRTATPGTPVVTPATVTAPATTPSPPPAKTATPAPAPTATERAPAVATRAAPVRTPKRVPKHPSVVAAKPTAAPALDANDPLFDRKD